MIYGILYLIGALFWVWLAGTLAGWGWILLWAGLNDFVMVAAYFGLGSRPFRKREDGSLPWSVYLYLGPQILITGLVCKIRRAIVREDLYNEVVPGLFLGARPLPGDLPADIRTIVDLTAEFPVPAEVKAGRRYVCVPILDVHVPSKEEFRRISEFVARTEEATYVHCAVGHGRSAAVMAAALVLRGVAKSPEDAIERIRSARPGIRIQRIQLERIRWVCDSKRGLQRGV